MLKEKFKPNLPSKEEHEWYKASTNPDYLRSLIDEEKSGWRLLHDPSIAESAYGDIRPQQPIA